ncbi:MAG: hypothetical protein ABSC08_14830, partial [Bryobacteraceae bacterium]
MRGIFARVLLGLFAILLLSVGGFIGSSILFAPSRMQTDRFFNRIIEYEFDGAVRAYESGGAPALDEYVGRLIREMGHHYFLLDAEG